MIWPRDCPTIPIRSLDEGVESFAVSSSPCDDHSRLDTNSFAPGRLLPAATAGIFVEGVRKWRYEVLAD